MVAVFFFLSGQRVPITEEKKDVIDTLEITLPPPIVDNRKIINDLHILHPAFRNKVVMLLYECKKEGIDLKIVETYRTHERQDALKRRKLTRLSGGCSKHQHFLAIDVVPVVNKLPRWHNKELWAKIGKIGEAQGLKWGGRWKRLYDPGHFEYPISIKEIDNIPIPDTVIVPLNY